MAVSADGRVSTAWSLQRSRSGRLYKPTLRQYGISRPPFVPEEGLAQHYTGILEEVTRYLYEDGSSVGRTRVLLQAAPLYEQWDAIMPGSERTVAETISEG